MARMILGRRALLGGALAAAAAGCASSGAPVNDAAARKQVAITIDDIPLTDGPFFTGRERARRIIGGLRKAGVTEAAFFANPRRPELDPEGRLRMYAAAGHVIANHSASHPNLAETSAADYLANVAEADAFLRPLPGFKPWFRFPYLSEGDTVEKRDQVRQGLIAMGYAQAYVTCDSVDWRTDMLCREAVGAGYEINRDALRDLHIRHTLAHCNAADRLATSYLGRSPKHVLLMHENDVEALFIADVVAALRADGWGICTATEAFNDPIASELPNTLELGEGRIGAMVQAAGQREQYPVYGPPMSDLENAFLRDVRGPQTQQPREIAPIP